MAVDHNNPQSRNEEILIAIIDGKEYNKLPQSRIEELLLELKETIEEGGGGGGTTNYNNLSNQPQVNGETLIGDKTGAELGLVDAEEGKGLSTNDYDDTEKAAVAAATSDITAIKDGVDIDSFGDVEVALLDKADTSDLGTAAAKDSTNSVTSGSTDLVESGAVKDAIDAAVAAAYHHAGTKTVAQLTHDLLVAANEGNVYNITDSGTTTSDFIEGIGKTINEGSNVGICKVGNVYMFDLLSGFVDTTNFVQKSQTAGLLNNDGTVNDEIEDDVDALKDDVNAIDSKIDDTTTYPYADVITILDAIPANLADCNVKIEPVQSGSGDPSPTNIRLITGHTEVSVDRVGFNIWDGTATDGKGVGNNGTLYNDATLFATGYVRVFPNVTYYLNSTNWKNWVWVYDGDKNVLQEVRVNTTDRSIVFPSGTVYARFTGILDSKSTACINVFNSALNGSYAPYAGKTYTISLGDTIYGGTVDFDTGVMTVDRALIEYDGSNDETWYDNKIENGYSTPRPAGLVDSICDKFKNAGARTSVQGEYWTGGSNLNFVCSEIITSLADWKTYLASNPLQICYELSTPTTIQLTPQQIQLLKGQNTLTASTGDISVTVNGVSGAIGQVQEQVNDITKQLPDAPTTDGVYALTVTVADGVPTYSWESAE